MSKFGVSQPVRRVEDERFLRGAGRYVDDVADAGQLRAVFLRSPVGHAVLTSVDVEAARGAPGVVAVFTGADLEAAGCNDVSAGTQPNRDGSKTRRPQRPVLAHDRVRYVGEAVAIVLAETLAQAKDAAELIEIDFDERDAVVDTARATDADAPQLHDEAPGNLANDWAFGDEAATDAAFAGAAHVVELELINNRVVANSMEPRGAIARWDAEAERLHVDINGQGVWGSKTEIAKRLKLDPEQVLVTCPDVGGGFGMKSFDYPEHIAVAHAARSTGRPVKWMAERQESFVSDVMGRDHVSRAAAAFDADHKLLAMRVDCVAAMGAYLSGFGVFIPTSVASRVLTGVYDVQTVHMAVKCVYTNTVPVDAYRGAGRPEAIYLLERLMDKSARELGVDAMALRRKNYIRPDQMPYKTIVGELYDTGDFAKVSDAAAVKADTAGFEARRAASEAAGKVRGLGYCYYIEAILGDPSETAKVELTEDGFADIYVGTQSNGQGHETAYAQILNQRSGIPFEKIRIVQGDSDRIAHGGGTGGSRSVTTQGVAINGAADALIEQLRPLAEDELEASGADIEWSDGAFRVVGTDRTVDLMSLGAKARATGRPELAMVEETTTLPGRSYPNGCHVAEVEIDPATGAVDVVKYTMVDDFGFLINPMLAEGQAQGGVVQGIGQAITEHVVYDEGGQLLSGSYMDYAMPRADDAPWLEFHHEPTPSTANPIGMKGCGEAGTVGALAAITNAALDALWPLGVRDVDMPLTPLRVWRTVEQARTPVAAE